MPLLPPVPSCHPGPVPCPHIPPPPQGNPGVVTCMGTEDNRTHLFYDGDLVTFSGVEGMTELNGQDPIPVHVLGEPPRGSQLPWPKVRELAESLAVTVTSVPLSSPDGFRLEIGDTSSFSPYRCGGLVSQVRLPEVHSYVSPPHRPKVLLPGLWHCWAVPWPWVNTRPSPGTVPAGAPAPGARRAQDPGGKSRGAAAQPQPARCLPGPARFPQGAGPPAPAQVTGESPSCCFLAPPAPCHLAQGCPHPSAHRRTLSGCWSWRGAWGHNRVPWTRMSYEPLPA